MNKYNLLLVGDNLDGVGENLPWTNQNKTQLFQLFKNIINIYEMQSEK